ncbi:MAG TPA: hypothetical protein V6C89_13050 [Drouetiella sp.]|jgi:hypothetical protein
MIRFASLVYFAISAVWSFLTWFALTSMIVVGEFENYDLAAPWFGAFEILSFLGMFWILVAILFTAYLSDKELWQGIPLRRNWAALMGFGHCAYFSLFFAGGLLLGKAATGAMQTHFGAVCLSVPAILLLLLTAGNVQAFRFAVKSPPRNSPP